jgi:superfamily I DNA/RNA helicase
LNLTDEQTDFVEKRFGDTLLLRALAGCGKTSSLVAFAERRAKEGQILYLAYNASMMKDAEAKFRALKHVNVMTIHALAYRAIGKDYRSRLGSLRAKDLLGYVGSFDPNNKREASVAYGKANAILSVLRGFCQSGFSLSAFIQYYKTKGRSSAISEFGPLAQYGISRLAFIWKEIRDNPALPFEHDFYLKLFHLTNPQLDYAYIMVDEAQDASPVMIEIVLRQYKAKKVFVGDSFQQIYGWRGAVNALTKLEDYADVCWLTNSWRCNADVANEANKYLLALGAEKTIKGLGSSKSNTRAFIARRNASVFTFCLDEIEKNPLVRFAFVGGIDNYNINEIIDVGKLSGYDPNSGRERPKIFHKLIGSFASWKEFLRYVEDANESDLSSWVNTAMRLKGELSREGMKVFYYRNTPSGTKRPTSLYEFFEEIKKRVVSGKNISDADVVISTAHRSKGLEWGEVTLAQDFFSVREEIRRILDGKEIAVEVSREELNLIYVAITRAKHTVNAPHLKLTNADVTMFRELIRESQIYLI